MLQLIESLGYKHTGSTADTVALCIDKARAKLRLMEYGVPTPAFQVFKHPKGDLRLNFPVIVKPVTEDGSLGIDLSSVVTNPDDLSNRITYVLDQYRQPALVEEFIPGREFAVSLWGNGVVEAMPKRRGLLLGKRSFAMSNHLRSEMATRITLLSKYHRPLPCRIDCR